MSKPDRPSLRSHAELFAKVARAYSSLARRHRSAADAFARKKQAPTAEGDFTRWLLEASELAANAELLLAYEVDLARSFGVKWDEIAEALGVSRQAVWERYAKEPRRARSRRYTQAMRALRADWHRSLEVRPSRERYSGLVTHERAVFDGSED